MAPNIPPWKRRLIQDMLNDLLLSINEIVDQAKCSRQTVSDIRSNIKRHGEIELLPKRRRLRRSIIHVMLDYLFSQLRERPHLFLDEMASLLEQRFAITVSPSTISRMLTENG